jgi:hypothetical protein
VNKKVYLRRVLAQLLHGRVGHLGSLVGDQHLRSRAEEGFKLLFVGVGCRLQKQTARVENGTVVPRRRTWFEMSTSYFQSYPPDRANISRNAFFGEGAVQGVRVGVEVGCLKRVSHNCAVPHVDLPRVRNNTFPAHF